MSPRRIALALTLALAAGPPFGWCPAAAQIEQTSVRLNQPALASQYLSVPDKTGLQGNWQYTIEAWVRPTSYSNFPTIVGNDFANSFWLGLSTNGRVRFYPRGGGFVEGGDVVPLDRWTHVAATYSSVAGFAIYLNGEPDTVGTFVLGVPGTSAGDLRIGADRSSGITTFYWRGWLDEVRVWSVARTGAQIRGAMLDHAGTPHIATPPYAGLVGYWDMEDPLADRFADRYAGLGAAANDAFLVSAPVADRQAAPLAYDTALQLNGADDHLVLPMTDGFEAGLTIEAWIAPGTMAEQQTIVGRDRLTGFWFGIGEAGKLRFFAGGGDHFAESEFSVTANAWTHVAVTYRNGETRFYRDGQPGGVSFAFTGPVGENGRDVFVGMDNEPGGPSRPFAGLIDEVRVTKGRLSRVAIRDGMFRLPPAAGGLVEDEDGVPRERRVAAIEHRAPEQVLGSGARFVRSGAPLFAPQAALYGAGLGGYVTSIVGTPEVPSGLSATTLDAVLAVPDAATISSVEVFVDAPTVGLERARVQLCSPIGTCVTLLDHEGSGRDLCTVFRDAATATLATGYAPYTDGVQPHASLSAFDGELATGEWHLLVEAPAAASNAVGLWTWGLAINGNHVAAAGPIAGQSIALRMAGPHPVREAGALAFTLREAADVALGLYDLGGRRVRKIAGGRYGAGTHRVAWSAEGLEPGVYFARLRALGTERGLNVSVMR